jgi:hypothetical protein
VYVILYHTPRHWSAEPKQAGDTLKWLEYPNLSVYSWFALMIVFYKPCTELFLSLEFHVFLINVCLWVILIVLVLLPAGYFVFLVLLHIERERCFESSTHMYQAFVMSCCSGNFKFLCVFLGQLLPKLSVCIESCFLSAVSDYCTFQLLWIYWLSAFLFQEGEQ